MKISPEKLAVGAWRAKGIPVLGQYKLAAGTPCVRIVVVSEREPRRQAKIRFFHLSCKTSLGVENWIRWLEQKISNFQRGLS